MDLLALHTLEECRYFHMLCYDRDGRYVVGDGFFSVFKRGKEVDVVDHTDDAVDSSVINGHTREIVLQKQLLDLFHRHIKRYRDDIDTRYVYIADLHVVEFDRA